MCLCSASWKEFPWIDYFPFSTPSRRWNSASCLHRQSCAHGGRRSGACRSHECPSARSRCPGLCCCCWLSQNQNFGCCFHPHCCWHCRSHLRRCSLRFWRCCPHHRYPRRSRRCSLHSLPHFLLFRPPWRLCGEIWHGICPAFFRLLLCPTFRCLLAQLHSPQRHCPPRSCLPSGSLPWHFD